MEKAIDGSSCLLATGGMYLKVGFFCLSRVQQPAQRNVGDEISEWRIRGFSISNSFQNKQASRFQRKL
jgi:hypothetical protein